MRNNFCDMLTLISDTLLLQWKKYYFSGLTTVKPVLVSRRHFSAGNERENEIERPQENIWYIW